LVIIVGSAWLGFADPTPTDRDQTTVASARFAVDEAIARVAAAVAGETAVVAVSGFEDVGSCEVSVFRDGGRYRRGLVVVVPPGTEPDLLRRVADRLPASYRAVARGGDTPRLSADAGYWVLLTGSRPAEGEVRFFADTGDCRPLGDVDATTDPDPAGAADAVREVLSRLDLGGGALTSASVSCMDGGVLGTVEARVGRYAGDLRSALGDLTGATVVVSSGRLFAYRTPTAQVAVRAHEDATIITATIACGA
jgi:hypothetical protein